MPFDFISNFPSLITIGEPRYENGLLIFPIYNKRDPKIRIVDSSNVSIRELTSETVPFLEAENTSSDMALILDSEVFAGGKQDRVLNQPVMLKPGQISKVPVSCVEQGRWSRSSGDFTSVGIMPSKLRSDRIDSWTQTIRHRKQQRMPVPSRENDQQEQNIPAWADFSDTTNPFGLTALSQTLSTHIHRERTENIQSLTWNSISQRRIEQNYRDTKGSLKDVIEETKTITENFNYPEQATGMIVCKRNAEGIERVQLVEWFDAPEIAQKRWDVTLRQQLEGYNDVHLGSTSTDRTISKSEIRHFLTCLTKMNCEEMDQYGCAQTVTLEHKNHQNTRGVVVAYENEICHLSLISA